MKRYLLALALLLLATPAMAVPAFDVCATAAGATGTGNLSWTHTPSGTPRGATLIVVQFGGGTDEVSTVTYGGTAMSEVTNSPNCKATGETACVHAFHLGASVPTGAQTVSVTVTGASTKRAMLCTVTAGGDTSVDATQIISSDGVANPSASIATTAGVTTFVYAALFSGESAVANIAKGADYTELLEDAPLGASASAFQRRTTNATGGAVTYNWVIAATDDAVAIGVAVREGVAAAGVGTKSKMLRGVGF